MASLRRESTRWRSTRYLRPLDMRISPRLVPLTVVLVAACGGSGASSGGGPGTDAGSRDSNAMSEASFSDSMAPPGGDSGNDGSPITDDGGGLAAQYCGDKGIENDPAVVFVERFDEGSIAAASANWDANPDNPQAMSLVAMGPPGSATATAADW